MSSSLWKNVLGYVIIKVDGYNLELFVNRCMCFGIRTWDVRRTAGNSMQLKMFAEDFYRLKKAISGVGCKVHIISKQGIPFKLARRRQRTVFSVGMILAFLAIFVLSRFVWIIDIYGCEQLSQSEISEYLKREGLDSGTLKSDIIVSDVGHVLRASDARIAWAGAEIDGVRLIVQIVEAKSGNVVDKSQPTCVIASKDGIVMSVETIGGKPCVTVGQAVRKGDILINGDLTAEDGKELLVHASGEVMAKVLYTNSATVHPKAESIVRTGSVSRITEVELFGIKLVSSSPYDDYETQLRNETGLRGCVLPIVFRFFDCFELSLGMKELTEDEMYSRAKAEAQARLVASIPENVAILSKSVDTVKNTDGSVTVTISIVTQEDIAEIKAIG